MTVDLMVQIVTIILVGYVGWHLRRELRTLKEAVATQKATIDAQAEQMKAQSTVLQDVERLNKMMQQAIDFREQAYRAQVERNALTDRRERIAAWNAAVTCEDFERRQFATSEAYATLKDHLPGELQQEIDKSRNPMMVIVLPRTERDLIQVRLLEEIAKVERQWGLI